MKKAKVKYLSVCIDYWETVNHDKIFPCYSKEIGNIKNITESKSGELPISGED